MLRFLSVVLLAASAQAQPAFDVASIKPSDRNLTVPYRLGPDVLSTEGTLMHLVMMAYSVESAQVVGGPPWAQSQFFNVQAKTAGPATAAQLRVMLQVLLADRFHLVLRRDTRMMSGYALIVDKNGPKLPAPKTDVPPGSTGVLQMGGGEIWARGSTLDHFAHGLWLELQMPVVNQTRIEGNYDFSMHFEEGNHELSDDSGPPSSKSVGSIFTAVREIGLKLEARKLPIEILVIEKAEHPTEN
ncbi:MAG: TIGR03435 family protein [Candidatus Solibacter sp.]